MDNLLHGFFLNFIKILFIYLIKHFNLKISSIDDVYY